MRLNNLQGKLYSTYIYIMYWNILDLVLGIQRFEARHPALILHKNSNSKCTK